MTDELKNRAMAVRLLLLDVDGVLTDGRITYTDAGDEIKRFHVRDGSGLKIWKSIGGRTAIHSGRTSKAVERRGQELGIDALELGQPDKAPAFARLLAKFDLAPEQVCGVGDDLPDLPVLVRCGLSIAVADACPELRAAANFVTTAPGGAGAVREAIEWLLKLRGEWDRVVEGFRDSK